MQTSLYENQGVQRLLNYWFGDRSELYRYDPALLERWFGAGPSHDEAITAAFQPDLEQAIRGELDHWAETADGTLALIVLLDQCSRHIHRGGPKAYAQDAKAQLLTCQGMDRGLDQRLRPIERVFFYMPLMHAEDLELQDQGVKAYADLVHSVPEAYRDPYRGFLEHAERHRDVILRFGRFPDSNAALGRRSTAEEEAYLGESMVSASAR
jgi:uncharacterized protein (DUF924 family)